MTSNSNRRTFLKGVAGSSVAVAGIAGCLGNSDEEYPSDTITYMIPFSEGGGTDTVARQLVPVMSEILGVSIAIENIPGSSSLRGIGYLVNAEPDGYYLGAFNPPSSPIAAIINPPDYDFQSVEGVCTYGRTAYCLYGNPDQVDDLDDLISKYDSGELEIIGGEQVGSSAHVAAFVLRDDGIPWDRYIGYDGSGPSAQAVANGEVPAGIASDGAGEALVKSGDITVLAYLTTEPTPAFPGADMIEDYGVRDMDFVAELTRGMYFPEGTSEEAIKTVADATREALEDDELQTWAENTGTILQWGPPETATEAMNRTFELVPEAVDIESFQQEVQQ